MPEPKTDEWRWEDIGQSMTGYSPATTVGGELKKFGKELIENRGVDPKISPAPYANFSKPGLPGWDRFVVKNTIQTDEGFQKYMAENAPDVNYEKLPDILGGLQYKVWRDGDSEAGVLDPTKGGPGEFIMDLLDLSYDAVSATVSGIAAGAGFIYSGANPAGGAVAGGLAEATMEAGRQSIGNMASGQGAVGSETNALQIGLAGGLGALFAPQVPATMATAPLRGEAGTRMGRTAAEVTANLAEVTPMPQTTMLRSLPQSSADVAIHRAADLRDVLPSRPRAVSLVRRNFASMTQEMFPEHAQIIKMLRENDIRANLEAVWRDVAEKVTHPVKTRTRTTSIGGTSGGKIVESTDIATGLPRTELVKNPSLAEFTSLPPMIERPIMEKVGPAPATRKVITTTSPSGLRQELDELWDIISSKHIIKPHRQIDPVSGAPGLVTKTRTGADIIDPTNVPGEVLLDIIKMAQERAVEVGALGETAPTRNLSRKAAQSMYERLQGALNEALDSAVDKMAATNPRLRDWHKTREIFRRKTSEWKDWRKNLGLEHLKPGASAQAINRALADRKGSVKAQAFLRGMWGPGRDNWIRALAAMERRFGAQKGFLLGPALDAEIADAFGVSSRGVASMLPPIRQAGGLGGGARVAMQTTSGNLGRLILGMGGIGSPAVNLGMTRRLMAFTGRGGSQLPNQATNAELRMFIEKNPAIPLLDMVPTFSRKEGLGTLGKFTAREIRSKVGSEYNPMRQAMAVAAADYYGMRPEDFGGETPQPIVLPDAPEQLKSGLKFKMPDMSGKAIIQESAPRRRRVDLNQ